MLVQRTAWNNAEQALDELRPRGLLEPTALANADPDRLRTLIRSAGFANSKAQYLRALASYVVDAGGLETLHELETTNLRDELLHVRGIGPETADAILLYLFERPVWVADAYAARLFSRLHGESAAGEAQSARLSLWTAAGRTDDLQELHALIVAHGKAHCRAAPLCADCPLGSLCAATTQP